MKPTTHLTLFVILTAQALAQYTIDITDYTYTPQELTINTGERITWTNKGNAPHTITTQDGTLNSGTLQTGDTYANIFDKPGTYTYGCTLHPNMKGTITVKNPTPTPDIPPGALVVVIRDNFFEPADMTIEEGETILWQNEGTRKHTVSATSPTNSFESGELNPGQRYHKTFTTPGTYNYQCNIHPSMKGTITVKPKQQTPPPTPTTPPPSSPFTQPTAPLDIQRLTELENSLTFIQEQLKQQQQEQQNLKTQANNAQEQTEGLTNKVEQLSIKPSRLPTILLLILNIIILGIMGTPYILPKLTQHKLTQEEQEQTPLTQYVQQAQQTGKTTEQIRTELLTAGWPEEEINKTLEH